MSPLPARHDAQYCGARGGHVLIKKYGNRRLYDTARSRYITLDELAELIRAGEDARVVDAKTSEDLTTATLVQIIIEGRGAAKLLPVPLLVQLIRLSNAALGEFMGRYLAGALELYLQAKTQAQAIAPYTPFATVPFTAADTFAQMLGGMMPSWGRQAPPQPRRAPEPPREDDVSSLRRELDELKQSLRKRSRKR